MTEHENRPSSSQPSAPDDPPQPPDCPDSPLEFLDRVADWALTFSKWARDVDRCYASKCETPYKKEKVHELCNSFGKVAVDLKTWADSIERCYKEECDIPRITGTGHPPPPDPPFKIKPSLDPGAPASP